MSEFRFFYPVQIRYADLDAQWHVNNARFLTILEQARLSYIRQLGLWDGKSFLDLGLIVADVHIAIKHHRTGGRDPGCLARRPHR
jgi:acyl-CoA thioester hydrolase